MRQVLPKLALAAIALLLGGGFLFLVLVGLTDGEILDTLSEITLRAPTTTQRVTAAPYTEAFEEQDGHTAPGGRSRSGQAAATEPEPELGPLDGSSITVTAEPAIIEGAQSDGVGCILKNDSGKVYDATVTLALYDSFGHRRHIRID